MLTDTGKFKVVEIIHNDTEGGFAIAKGYWDHDATKPLRLACRWYEEGGIGYPQTFGKPQWMMLPENIRLDIRDALTASEQTNIQLCINPNKEACEAE